jgi:NAD(P)-dependent dehydrogenase (short-subunit alcohol dehydrogenase family)
VPINAAGTNALGTVEELDVKGRDRTFYVSTRAPFCCPKPLLPPYGDGSGTLINVSSVQARRARPTPRPTAPPSSGSQALPKVSLTMYVCDWSYAR